MTTKHNVLRFGVALMLALTGLMSMMPAEATSMPPPCVAPCFDPDVCDTAAAVDKICQTVCNPNDLDCLTICAALECGPCGWLDLEACEPCYGGCPVFDCDRVKALNQLGVCDWIEELPGDVRDCLRTTTGSLGSCVPSCTANDAVQCAENVCNAAVGWLPGSWQCSIQDPCDTIIDCSAQNVCSDHVDSGIIDVQPCNGQGWTCVGQYSASITCVHVSSLCVGALQGIGYSGMVVMACVERSPTCVDTTISNGFNDMGTDVCYDDGAACVQPLGNSVYGLTPLCAIVRDNCVDVHAGYFVYFEEICVPDDDGDLIPDDVESSLCGRQIVRDTLNQTSGVGRCNSSTDFERHTYGATAFIPTMVTFGADGDGDGVPSTMTLRGITATVDTDGNVGYGTGSEGPFTVDPDDNDRNSPVPFDDVDDAVEDVMDAVEDTIDTVWDTMDLVNATADWAIDQVWAAYHMVDGDDDGVADAAEPWVCQVEDQNTPLDGSCSGGDYSPPV